MKPRFYPQLLGHFFQKGGHLKPQQAPCGRATFYFEVTALVSGARLSVSLGSVRARPVLFPPLGVL